LPGWTFFRRLKAEEKSREISGLWLAISYQRLATSRLIASKHKKQRGKKKETQVSQANNAELCSAN
jgi:hypothetical protein